MTSALPPYTRRWPPSATRWNLLGLARLEAHGRSRREIEPHAVGRLAVEDQGPVDLEKMEMGADLDRPVARVR